MIACERRSIFGDPIIATAILGRLLHHSTVINVRRESCRLRNAARPDGSLQPTNNAINQRLRLTAATPDGTIFHESSEHNQSIVRWVVAYRKVRHLQSLWFTDTARWGNVPAFCFCRQGKL